MSNFLSRANRRYQLKKLMAKPRRKELKRYADIKKILLIFMLDDEASWAIVNKCVQQLELQGRRVWVVGFVPTTYKLNCVISRTNTYIIHEKDGIGFLGLPHEEDIALPLENQYDMLIDVTGEPNFFAQYMALRCDAGMRVAYVRRNAAAQSDEVALDNTKVYDFTIQGDFAIDVRKFMDDLEKYLVMILK